MLVSGRCTLEGVLVPRAMHWVCLFVFGFCRAASPGGVVFVPGEARVLFFSSVPHLLFLVLGMAFLSGVGSSSLLGFTMLYL